MTMQDRVHVSDHALERYRERIGSPLSDEDLRMALATLLRPPAVLRARRYKLHGVTFCFKHRDGRSTVTTVYEGDESFLARMRAPRSDPSRAEARRRSRSRKRWGR